MISTISQHKINTNCLNQYNKNFRELKVNILKSVLTSLVFGKTLFFGKGKLTERLSTPAFSANVGKSKHFTVGKKQEPQIRQRIGGQVLSSLPKYRQSDEKVKSPGEAKSPLNFTNNIWGVLLFSREDLAFINLRGLLSTLLKALQVCLFALFNNKRIIFVGDAQPLVQEHHQRLLSCFITNQAKVFTTNIGDRLPPILPSQPKMDKENQLVLARAKTDPKKTFLPKSENKIRSLTPYEQESNQTSLITPTGFCFADKQSQDLQGVKNSIFGNLHALINTKITKLDKVGLNEYTPVISLQPHAQVFTNILSSGQSSFAANRIRYGGKFTSNMSQTFLEKGSQRSVFPVSQGAKIVELHRLNKQEAKDTKIKKSAFNACTVGHILFATKGQGLAPTVQVALLPRVKSQGHKEPTYKGKLENWSENFLEPGQKGMDFQTYKPLDFESTKMGHILFSLNKYKYFRKNRGEDKKDAATKVSSTLDLRQRLGLSSTKLVKNGVSRIIEKSVPFKILFKLQGRDTNLNTDYNSIPHIKGSFIESQPFSLPPHVRSGGEPSNGLTNHLSDEAVRRGQANNATGAHALTFSSSKVKEPIKLNASFSPKAKSLTFIDKVSKEKTDAQGLKGSIQENLVSNLPVTYSHFYAEMAKLVSKAAIRSCQWTATLAQPTNYWIGGFFSNSSATYKQNLSSTTLLNIKMDPQCQLQQFRDLYYKSKFTKLEVFKDSQVSEKTLLGPRACTIGANFKQSKDLLIAALAEKKGLKNKLSTRFDVSLETSSSSKAAAKKGQSVFEKGSLNRTWSEKEDKRQNHSENRTSAVEKVVLKGNNAVALEKARLAEPFPKEDKKLFFEKSFFSMTTTLPLGNHPKQSISHHRCDARAGNDGLRGPVHLLDSISEFSGGLWSAIYAPVARKHLVNRPETPEFYTQRKPASKSFRGQIPKKIKIFKKQKGRSLKGINKRIIDHCLYSIDVNKATNAWLNEADLVFFANPEKNLSLLNQINRLKIPTIGIINSGSDLAFPFRSVKGSSLLSAKQTITYPIIGNSNSLNFLRIVLTKFACVLSLKRA